MFIEYIKERFIEEYDLINKLINIDKKIQGVKFDINIFNNIKNYNFIIESNDIFVLEGNSKSLIILLNQLVSYDNSVIINRNNLAINKWIVKKYNEYCDICGIGIKLKIFFSDVFNECKGKYIVIGSEAFILEHKYILSNEVVGIIFK